MPTYNFKQEAQVYVVSGGNRHRIDVTDIDLVKRFLKKVTLLILYTPKIICLKPV